jgi:tetratricopeptide (TPR) repeat protein
VVWQQLGDVLRELGEDEEAVGVYRRALELQPGLAGVEEKLAGLLSVVSGSSDVKTVSRSAKNFYLEGEAKFKQGRLDEAIFNYTEAISLDSQQYIFYHRLGNALVAKRQLDEAVNCYRLAIGLAPSYCWSHYHLGIALESKGHIDEAIACYRNAVDIDPNVSEFQSKLRSALNNASRSSLAYSAVSNGIGGKPSKSGNTGLKNAKNTGKPHKGKIQEDSIKEIDAYYKILSSNPHESELYLQLSSALSRNNKQNEALIVKKIAEQVVSYCPKKRQ